MVILTDKNNEQSALVNEEFDKYLMEQRMSATFNGIEVAEFSWYKKLLGLKD
jgi:hypothetical protein